jgi:hypothetical protein
VKPFDLYFYPAGVMLFTPWYWFDLWLLQDGGFHCQITNPRIIKSWMGPEYVGEIYARPHSMAIMAWVVPRTPRQWWLEVRYCPLVRWVRKRLGLGAW